MALKYDFNITSADTGNLFSDGLAYANNNINGLLIYGIVLFIFLIALYVNIKISDDISLSLIRSLFISTILSIMFYYWGLSVGVTFFSGSILIAMVLILSASGGVIYYSRNKVGGD